MPSPALAAVDALKMVFALRFRTVCSLVARAGMQSTVAIARAPALRILAPLRSLEALAPPSLEGRVMALALLRRVGGGDRQYCFLKKHL